MAGKIIFDAASCLLLSALCLCTSCDRNAAEATKTPKAVFIVVDGISADVIEKLDLPALQDISKEEGYSRAYVGGESGTYTETPTISAVGYNSLLTGTWANKHNVWGNDIRNPNYHYRHIFRIAEEHNPGLETAIFSTWTDNRTKLIGEGLPQTGQMTLDYKFDGLEHDTLQYPHEEDADYIRQIDEAVASEAERYIRTHGPDLSWVYLQYTDDMGHRFGDSERFYDAVRTADQQVGRIWRAVKEREKESAEDWLIVVTTDHGRDPVSGKHHGGQSARERLTWIVTNAGNLNERFQDTPAIVDIMPSICNHMNIPIPEDLKKEIDGVPFIGKADVSDLTARMVNGKVQLTWKDLGDERERKGEIFVAETNHFKVGGRDIYRKMGEVPIASEQYTLEIDSGKVFYKVVIKGPNHYANVWCDN